MKSSVLLSLFLFLFLGAALNAQSIQGKLLLPDGKVAEFATVTLHQANDSTVVKGAITGTDGAYELTGISSGNYFLRAGMIGLGDVQTPAFEYDGNAKTMDNLSLNEASQEIKEVTVTARKPTIEVKADKTVLNVEGTVNSTGLSALELLRKAPGVTIDNNDNVNIKGKNGVNVMIDGREVQLDGKDLAAMLKGLQASDIANIEIISNPSAKYDAAGNAGIINIKLRKNKALGTNGNVGAELIQGITPKAGMNASINHRDEKVALFATYNNHYGRWHDTQNFYREQNGLTFDQEAESYYMSRWNSARTGADWFINDKHTVGIILNGSTNPSSWVSDSRTNIGKVENPGGIDSILIAENTINDKRLDLNVNLNYRYSDTTGRSFNIDFDRGAYRLEGNSFQPNTYVASDGTTVLNERDFRTITPTDIDILTGKTDYEQGLFKGTFGAGLKFANVRTDNTFSFYNIDDEGVETLDTAVSNQFKYTETTSAGYVNYQRQFGKLHVQGGLRVENTDYTGNLIAYSPQDGEKVENNYTELFPSAALTYKFNDTYGLNATYSRRIDRPSYQDLNPFEFRLDELTYQKGNPMLRPQFTNSFELSPTYKGQPAISLGYSHTKDLFTQVLDTTGTSSTFMTQENIADQRNYTATINIPTPFAKWWEGFVSVTGVHSDFSAEFREGFSFSQSFNAFNLYAEQTVRLPKGWSLQLSGWYNSKAFWGTLQSDPQGVMDFGVQKKVFGDKGEVRLRFGDLLNTAGWGGENVFTPGLVMKAKGTWEARTITLNFSYRFGSTEVKGARQRKTGLEEEGARVKSRG